jgi:hypothetical protein
MHKLILIFFSLLLRKCSEIYFVLENFDLKFTSLGGSNIYVFAEYYTAAARALCSPRSAHARLLSLRRRAVHAYQ